MKPTRLFSLATFSFTTSRSSRKASLLAVTALSLFGSQIGQAAGNYVWLGTSSGTTNWGTTTNWSPTGVPTTSADYAIFSSSTPYAPSLKNVAYTIGGLQFSFAGQTLTINHGNASLTAVNTVVNQTATLDDLSGNTSFATTNLQVDSLKTFNYVNAKSTVLLIPGRLSGAGTVTYTGGSISLGAASRQSPGGTSTVAGVYSSLVGTQTINAALTYTSGSIFEWDLNASTSDTRVGETYDKVVANGAVTGISKFNVILGSNNFTSQFWDTNKTWTDIFTGTGSKNLSSIFTTIGGTGVTASGTQGIVAGRGYFSFSSNTLNWTNTGGAYVPEPTSALAGLLLAAGLLRRRRL
ncbi:MAG: hypothetical protein WCS43_10940 [Verrucomicrobiota bacterium]